MVGRGRGWWIVLVGGIQELMETGGGLAIVVAVSLDGADVAVIGRCCSIDGSLRHVI